MSGEETDKKRVARIEDLIIKQEEIDQELWQSIISMANSGNIEEIKRATSLILNNYTKIPMQEAEDLLKRLIEPSQDEDIRISVAQHIKDNKIKITWRFYLDIVTKLFNDPSVRVREIIKDAPVGKSASQLLEQSKILSETIAKSIAPIIEYRQYFLNSFQNIYRAISIPQEALRKTQSTIGIFQKYSESMSTLMKAVEAYRNTISMDFVIPNKLLEPIQFQVPKLVEGAFDEGLEQEQIEEIKELMSELKEAVTTLPIFTNVKNNVISGLDSFSSQNFPSAFSTLLDTVEGVVRDFFVINGLGGTNQDLSPMAEKLRSEKWIRLPTESLIKSLDRDKADHALYGEHSDFPETTSRLVILCLLKIARDYIYFKVLRQCLNEIIKKPKYSRFTVDHVLSLAHNRQELHIERKFVKGKIQIIITLYGKDVFRFKSDGPNWTAVVEES